MSCWFTSYLSDTARSVGAAICPATGWSSCRWCLQIPARPPVPWMNESTVVGEWGFRLGWTSLTCRELTLPWQFNEPTILQIFKKTYSDLPRMIRWRCSQDTMALHNIKTSIMVMMKPFSSFKITIFMNHEGLDEWWRRIALDGYYKLSTVSGHR